MDDLKLIALKVESFKGCVMRDVRFDGRNAVISGRNGTGKTTHYDALCWLLFGKDAAGNMPDGKEFRIMPEADGQVAHGVMPTVEATLAVNGEEVVLRREYAEIWTKPRGAAEAVLSGHETRSYIDGVLKGDRAYKSYIASTVDERLFRLLAHVSAFCTMKDADRRALLFEMCETESDLALMTRDARFAALAGAIGKRTIEDYKSVLRADRRKLNNQLDELPVRIDECTKGMEAHVDEDFSHLAADLSELEAREQALHAEIARIENNTAAADADVQLRGLRADLRTLEAENDAHRRSQEIPVVDARPGLRRTLDELTGKLAEAKRERDRRRASVTQAELRLDEYRDAWKKAAAEQCRDAACPTCGQKLPPAQAAKVRAQFEDQKTARLSGLQKDSDRVKDGIRMDAEQIERLERRITELEGEIAQTQTALQTAAAPEEPGIEDLPDYAARKAQLMSAISATEATVHELGKDAARRASGLRLRMEEVRAGIRTLQAKQAARDNMEAARARMEAYRAQQREVSGRLDRVDRLIFDCEEFVRYKAEQVTAAINAKFGRLRFRLFDQQINGGLRDCCDILYDGKPYGTISDGEKIKAGLDAVASLSAYYGVRVPLFVDRAESVTDRPRIDTQMIWLKVTEEEELTYEFEG